MPSVSPVLSTSTDGWNKLIVADAVAVMSLGKPAGLAWTVTVLMSGSGSVRSAERVKVEAYGPIVAAYAFAWLLDDQFGLIPHWINVLSGERLAPLFGLQRLGELVQLAFEDAIEVVHGQLYAVVGDPVLRIVVGPDLLGALA